MKETLILVALVAVVFIIKHFFFRGVNAEEALAVYREGAAVLDVRSHKEYAIRHIDEAHNIPLDQLEHEAELRLKDKDQPILLYCESGSRSALAARILKRRGFKRVYNIGGFHAAERFSQSLRENLQP